MFHFTIFEKYFSYFPSSFLLPSSGDTNHRRPTTGKQRYSNDFPPPAPPPLFTSAAVSSVHFCYRHLRSPINHQICIRSDLIYIRFHQIVISKPPPRIRSRSKNHHH
ncbi:unnamed protein product [Lactuca virosa]|uniref:Uncharacterized protein n=1 Tax=Lactuca virosa TaxID=75947 RepID=A0AAU9LUC1_9ASTR|nr:unnamed protein product [Lactuca virosa]